MVQTLLIIDDSPEIHALLDVRLRPEGLRIEHAMSPEEGVSVAATLQPDLILLDMEMPGMSGLDVCAQLKDGSLTATIPVIFLTGSESVELKVRGFELGAVDYVTKPFQPAELRARVRAALRTKRYQDMLAAQAQLDGLTGLRNRSYFDQRLREEIEAARRYGRRLSLVLLDLDHFKRLNDDHGHPFGDLVLQRIGEALSATARSTDAACRYGGEELALLLTETSSTDAVLVAERIRVMLKTLVFSSKGQTIEVTGSFGVSDAASLGASANITAEALLQRADQALYTAKREGRDRVVCLG